MLTLYQSNRLSVLKSSLFEILQLHKSANPLASETILVGDTTIENWLTIALASEFKIVAGINFNSPSNFLWQLQQQELAKYSKDNPLSKSNLIWQIINIIDNYIDDTNFSVLKHYINYADHTELRKYQLAQKIASLFIDYIKYRPDLLINWQNNGNKAIDSQDYIWQPILWRDLIKKIDITHKDLLVNILQPDKLTKTITAESIPKNIFLFGINSLAKATLQSFYVLAKKVNIHIFSHNPSRYYWGDNNISSKNKAKNANLTNDSVSHVLLDTMGKLGRDYFNSLDEIEVNTIDTFTDDYQQTILGKIQADIYHLQDSRKNADKYNFVAEDDSLLFHSCHSHLRELQILQDRMLNWFTKDTELTPKDILVVAPDINLYTPWIHGVFTKEKYTDNTYIPYSICNASNTNLNDYASITLKLLMLDKTRCTGEEILEILSVISVRQKFDISHEDLTIIKHWIKNLNICWGLDAKHRHNFLETANDMNTWEFGINRLLLGYAIPEESGILHDILPSEFANGKTAELVGKLVDFLATINNIASCCPQTAIISDWITWVNNSVATVYLINDYSIEFSVEVASLLHKLADSINFSNYSQPITKDILHSYLQDKLTRHSKQNYIPNGKLTFSNINSLSSAIPFKIVCFLGMNSSNFPSYGTPVDFDLKAKYPRAGDELKKDQDRYNFIQLFAAAENKVHISFIGQSINDNSIKMPSIVIEEIIDYFNLSFNLDKTQINKQHPLILNHALQPFSNNNFQSIASNYFSYAASWQATNNKQKIDNKNTLNLEPATDNLELKTLTSFFKNPVKYFYTRYLGIYFNEPEEILPDSEPFSVDDLESYKLKQETINALYNKLHIDEFKSLYKAAGKLPHYLFADCIVNTVVKKSDKILAWLCELNINLHENINIEINFSTESNLHITAEITKFSNAQLVFIHPVDKLKGKNIIEAWLAHLCCCSQQQTTTYILCLKTKLVLKAVEASQALDYLLELTTIYQQAENPLPWLPCIAYELINDIKKQEAKEAIIDHNDICKNKLETYITSTNEKSKPDVYVAKMYPDLAKHHQQFYSLTERIFSPVLEYLQDTTSSTEKLK